LFTVPTRGDWVVILNRVADQWGAFAYDPQHDALRMQATPARVPHQEWLTFSVPQLSRSAAQVVLGWEQLEVAFTVDTDVVTLALANIERTMKSERSESGETWRTPYQAAEFCYNFDVKPEQAARWVALSIARNENYVNVRLQARLAARSGNLAAAITAAERAIALGRDDRTGPIDTAPMQRELSDWRAAQKTNQNR
jgi:hypothetical protein